MAVDHTDLERSYSAKTDDELLALIGERRSLEPEAESVLWTELRGRQLTDSHFLHPRIAEVVPKQNLAFNLPARAGALLILLMLGGLGLTIGIAAAREHQFFSLVAIFLLFWGPIFAAIAWAVHRTLHDRLNSSPKNHRHEHGGKAQA